MDNERTKHIVVRENLTVNECFITRGSVLTNIVIATFFIMWLFGYSINVLTLLAIVLATGQSQAESIH